MAPRTFDYTNNFDTGLTEATSTTNGASASLMDAPASGDADNEYAFFSQGGESAHLDLNAEIGTDERVTSFSATMQMDINASGGGFGNNQPDGMSFNLTDQTEFPPYGGPEYEIGSFVGLSVRVIPYSWDGGFGNEMRVL